MDEIEKNPIVEACTAFGDYLNVTGVAEALASTFLSLFLMDEKPKEPIEYIREHLDLDLNKELATLHLEIEQEKAELERQNERLAKLKAEGFKLIEEALDALEGDELLDGEVQQDTESKDDSKLKDAAETKDCNKLKEEGNATSEQKDTDTPVTDAVENAENQEPTNDS